MSATSSERPRLLLLGSSGQLGQQLLRVLENSVDVEAPTRALVDMSQPRSVAQTIAWSKPQWIVNAAAYTQVDRAELEPDVASTLNAECVRVIAEEAAKIGAAVVHYSTDYVFSGTKSSPYVESDETAPVSTYGRSKLDGEVALKRSSAAHMIFRISWLYGATGTNFLRTILRHIHKSASTRVPVRIVNDQQGSPTWTHDVAEATRTVIERISAEANAAGISPGEAMKQYTGIYHLCGSGETTWYGFAAEALMQARVLVPQFEWGSVVPINTDEYPTPAKRPKNSRLDCSLLREKFSIQLPAWQDSLTSVMKEIAAAGPEALG